jgi:hypothetical protein
MQCNIDAVGQAARLKMGLLGVAFSVVLGALILLDVLESVIWNSVLVASLIGGLFAIFEARAGWCVIRAMGFKTRI